MRLLAAGKLWNDHQALDPERTLSVLSQARRGWPELDRWIGQSRRQNWNRLTAEAARRFLFLRELTPFERTLALYARHHSLRAKLSEAFTPYVRSSLTSEASGPRLGRSGR